MKVLLCSPNSGDGGIARWTNYIVSAASTNKGYDDVEVELLPMNSSVYLGENAPMIKRIRYGVNAYVKFLSTFNAALRKSLPDVVHICSSGSLGMMRDYLMIRLCRKLGIKTYLHFHFGRIPDLKNNNNWEWKLLRKVCKKANHVIVMDERSSMALNDLGAHKVSNIPNPISEEVLHYTVQESPEFSYSNVYFVGHLLKTKGVYELIELLENSLDLTLNLIGSDPQNIKFTLSERIKQNNLQNRVHFLGQKSHNEVLDYIKKGIFVFPSHTEGFPNVILEAMACGIPIVSSNVGAIPEMLAINSSEPCGICIEPQNVQQLQHAVEQIRANKSLSDTLRHNAAKRVRQNYSASSVYAQLCACWNSL